MSDNLLFPKMDNNYFVTMEFNNDIYGFVTVVCTVAEDGSNEVYKVTRTIEYSSNFNGLRDRMFAGLVAIYNKIFNQLQYLKNLQQGELKNYFCVAIETGNDMNKQILDYDIYFIKAQDTKELLESERFKNIPGIEDDKIHRAIFNYGYQYENDFDGINIQNTIYHMRCHKYVKDGLKRYVIPEGKKFDTKDNDIREFITSLFSQDRFNDYTIGLTMEVIGNE